MDHIMSAVCSFFAISIFVICCKNTNRIGSIGILLNQIGPTLRKTEYICSCLMERAYDWFYMAKFP